MSQHEDTWPGAASRLLHDHPIATIGGCAIVFLMIVLWLFAPNQKAAEEVRIHNELQAGDITKIAEAPDGATIWAVQRDGKTIYFSKGSIAIEQAKPDAS